jgi:hypothetical protein
MPLVEPALNQFGECLLLADSKTFREAVTEDDDGRAIIERRLLSGGRGRRRASGSSNLPPLFVTTARDGREAGDYEEYAPHLT